MKFLIGIHICMLVFICSCKDPESIRGPFAPTYDPYNLSLSVEFDSLPSTSGPIELSEASGMVPLESWENGLWLINDSGDGPNIHLVNKVSGRTICKLTIVGLTANDWEDLGQFVDSNGISWLYIGDIGDNIGQRPFVELFRFKEPKIEEIDTTLNLLSWVPTNLEYWKFTYPEGGLDAEAFWVDPVTGKPWIVTKRTMRAMLYSLPKVPENHIDTAVFEGSLPLQFITSADTRIYPNGICPIVMRNYSSLWIWERISSESIQDALNRAPKKLPYSIPELQGESICFLASGGYAVVSERVDSMIPVIYSYDKK